MGEAQADGDAPPLKRPDRLDTVLNVSLGALATAVIVIAVLFGVSIWQSRSEATLSTPVHRLLETVKQQVRKNPNNLALRIELGRAYASIGQLDDGIEQLENALKIDPESVEAYYFLGRIAMLKDDATAANRFFTQVIALTEGDQYANLNPRREESLYALGLVALDAKKYEDAIGYLRGATRIRKDASDTYYQLARAYWGLGENEAAHEQLDITYAFDPRFAEALYLSGEIYLSEGDEVNASHWFYLAAAAAPDADVPQEALASFGTAEERVAAGREALASDDVEQALVHALVATNTEPDDFHAHLFHAEVLVVRDDIESAIEVYKKALERAPESEKTGIEGTIKTLESNAGS